jgi:type II secretory ATPase GspE/PulE/Tfp pilus assembly ATPase PilB-like protein
MPFNPIKLILLVAWIYLCLYCVQRAQFSPLVPRRYKSAAYVVTLFTGPLLLGLLLVASSVVKSLRSGAGILETLSQQVREAGGGVRSRTLAGRKKHSVIRLLNSSGRNIKEIYGHGERKRKGNHILNLTEQVIGDALDRKASDILIDPADESTYTIRLRIDGVIRTVKQLKAETCKAVVNSIKAVSSMDISEKRRPQDGAFIAKKGDSAVSFRVASAGALNGEKLSIRILNQGASTFALAETGFTRKQCEAIRKAISKPSGMVLMCGPTSTGKTTTMYAMLNEIDLGTRNVITVEDPIEGVLSGVSQIEINPKADITFAKTLRSVLRQDPDVICVGEIRDEETAKIALRASQTGHLVLATVHCDGNTAAMIRLMDLGVSAMLLSSGLSALVSQRLLRKLCEHCKKPAQLTRGMILELREKRIDHRHIFDAVGCERCDGTGYSGRTAVCSIMIVTDELRADIADNRALTSEMRTKGARKDRTNLRKEGMRKVASGITSLQELKRVVG